MISMRDNKQLFCHSFDYFSPPPVWAVTVDINPASSGSIVGVAVASASRP